MKDKRVNHKTQPNVMLPGDKQGTELRLNSLTVLYNFISYSDFMLQF